MNEVTKKEEARRQNGFFVIRISATIVGCLLSRHLSHVGRVMDTTLIHVLIAHNLLI